MQENLCSLSVTTPTTNMNIDFIIKNAKRIQSDKAKFILAGFDLDISCDDGVLVTIKSCTLLQNKEGGYYFQGPTEPYKATDENGNETTKRKKLVMVWPDKQNWGRQDQIVRKVCETLGIGSKGAAPAAKPAAAPTNKPAPAKATAPTQQEADDAW